MAISKPNKDIIDVYSWPTPNGHKVHIMLEDDYTWVIRKALRGLGFTPADAAAQAASRQLQLTKPAGALGHRRCGLPLQEASLAGEQSRQRHPDARPRRLCHRRHWRQQN